MVEEILISSSTPSKDELGFEFVQLEVDPKNFPTLYDKDNQELFKKWGISDANLEVLKFRFNQSFNSLQSSDFLKDFFNSKIVQSSFTPAHTVNACEGVDFMKVNCNVINMEYFDVL